MTVADVTITHTAADGTLAEGDPRPHQQHLKSAGFRWSRNLGAWYLPASRDRAPRRDVIARAADGLRSAGLTVEVTVDEAARPAAEREADAAARSAARAAGLDAKATRLGAIADETLAAARARADMIPLGQPILVGHHSERRHRRDLERINAGYDRGLATAREADETARRAAAATARQEHRLTGPATVRRLETLRGEDRRIARIIAGTQYAHTGPAEGAYLERLQGRATELADEIGYWERHLAELAAAGEYELPPAAEFTVGQRVLSRGLDIMPQVTRPVSLDKIDAPAPELEPTT